MRLSQLFVELKLASDNYNNGLRAAQREAKAFENSVKPMQKALADVEAGFKSAGKTLIVAFTAPIAAIAGVGVAFNAMQEQAQIAFTTMLGDGRKAKAFLDDLKDFAAKTPFEFPDLVRASQRLMAMGFAANEVKPLLTSVSDAVAGLGGGAAEIDAITLALGQMIGRGKIATQEMNQLTERGIPAWAILGKSMNLSRQALQDLVEKGLVPAGKAVEALLEGMNEKFGGMTALQSQSFKGMVSTIKDETRFLAGELTEGLFEVIKGPMGVAVDALHELRTATEGWSNETKTAAAVVAGLVAAAGPLLFVVGTLAGSLNNLILVSAKLPALFAAIGGAATVAAVGVGALGAAIGIGIGAFVNYLIEGTRVERWLDAFTTQALKSFIGEWGAAAEAQELAAFTANAVAKAQANHTAVTKTATVAELELAGAFKGLQGPAGTVLDIVKEMIEAKTRAKTAFDDFRKAVDKVKESVTGNAEADRALVQAVKELQATHVPMVQILDKLGARVTELVPEFKKYADAVEKAASDLEMWSDIATVANTRFDEQARAFERMNRHYEEVIALSQEATQAQMEWNVALEKLIAISEQIPRSLPLPTVPPELITTPGSPTPGGMDLPGVLDKMKNAAKDIFGGDWVRNSMSAIVGVANAFGGQVARIVNQVEGIISSLASGDIWGAIARGAGMIVNAITSAFGRGRKAANEFVQGTQNPATDAIKALFDGLENAKAMGTLTVAETERARDAFEKLWTDFQSQAREAGTVGQQALATMTPFVASWREWLDGLEGAAVDLEHMNAVFAKAGQVTMAATGFDVLEDAIQALLDTGQSTAHIVHFLGSEITDMAETMRILGIAIPPATQAMLELIEAAKAVERIGEIDTELADVFDSLADALRSKLDAIDQAIDTSTSNITEWTSEIDGLSRSFAEQSKVLQDASHWQKEYDNAIRESANELKRITDERKSAEERIANLTEQIERDRLTRAVEQAKARAGITETLIETITTGLTRGGHAFTAINRTRSLAGGGGGDSGAAEAALAQFEARIREQQRQARVTELAQLRTALPEIIARQREAEQAYAKASVAAQEAIHTAQQELRARIELNEQRREELRELIPLERERIAMLESQRTATLALMETLGIARLREFEEISNTINGLIDRANALVAERQELSRLPGVTAQATAAISAFIASLRSVAQQQVQAQVSAIAAATTRYGTPLAPHMPLPSYDVGVASVPVDQIAQVHKGERILSKDDNAALLALLRELIAVCRANKDTYLDLHKVSAVMNNGVEHGSIKLTASHVKR